MGASPNERVDVGGLGLSRSGGLDGWFGWVQPVRARSPVPSTHSECWKAPVLEAQGLTRARLPVVLHPAVIPVGVDVGSTRKLTWSLMMGPWKILFVYQQVVF